MRTSLLAFNVQILLCLIVSATGIKYPAMNIPKLNVVAIGSAIGAILLWGWQPIESLFTGEFNENLNVQINSEVVETCKPEKLLVLHIAPQNKGSVPIEIGGKKGGTMVVNRSRYP